MNKTKKIIIAIIVSCLLVFSITPKRQDEVHGFAITGTALAIGTIATIIVGGKLVSETVTETFGDEIIQHVTQTGQNISDFLNFNNRTNILNLMTSAVVLNAIRDVTHNKVTDIDLNQTGSVTLPETISLSYIAGRTRPFHVIKPNNPHLIKKAIADHIGSSILSLTLSSPILGRNASIEIGYVSSDGLSSSGEHFRVQQNSSGDMTLTQGRRITSNAHITLPADSIYISVISDPVSANPPLTETEISNITFTNPNVFTIDDDLVGQFGNVARGSEQIQDRINTQVQTGVNYDFAIPKDVTTIRDLPSITTGRATTDMDVPTEDVPSGIFAIVFNIWNLLKNIPSRVAAAFAGLFEYIGSAIQSFMDMISSMFGSLMGMLGSIISNIWSAIGTVSSAVSNIGTNITNAIWNGVNSVLWNINGSITSLSGDVRDLLINIPDAMSGLWEDAGLVWSGIGNTLTNIGTNIGEFAQSIIDSIAGGIDNIRVFTGDLINTMNTRIDNVATNLVDRLTGIVLPDAAAIERIDTSYHAIGTTFKRKFEFFIVPMELLKQIYLAPRSLYDLYITIFETRVYIFPRMYQDAVDTIRVPLNGVVVLLTFIGIYKRLRPKDVITS